MALRAFARREIWVVEELQPDGTWCPLGPLAIRETDTEAASCKALIDEWTIRMGPPRLVPRETRVQRYVPEGE